jgi:hypothetical protein
VRRAGVELDGDEAGERAVLLIVVDEDRPGPAVELVFETVAASDAREFVLLRKVSRHARTFADLPALAGRIHYHVDPTVVPAKK